MSAEIIKMPARGYDVTAPVYAQVLRLGELLSQGFEITDDMLGQGLEIEAKVLVGRLHRLIECIQDM